MKKQTRANIAMGAFLTACLIPGLGLFLPGRTETAANQTLAPVPELTGENGAFNIRVLNETADYAADHLGFRQELITANAMLNAGLFGVSSEESVLLGRDGWLFYRETLEDYLHTAPMSGRQLYGAARTLALLEEYAEKQGARLYVTVAPNKASLYPEKLPAVGTPLEGECDIDRLAALLETEGVAYIDLFEPFRRQEEALYYRQDSHWNTKGAALAHDALVSAMGKTDQKPFFPGPTRQGEEHLGDLYEMLYPAGGQTETDQVFERPFAFSYVRPIRSPEDQRIETTNGERGGSLLMFRDSFGNSLHTFMADAYGSALFSRAMPYPMSLLGESGADTVLIEIVERNLPWLAERAPIFPAPERVLTGVLPEGEATASLTETADGQMEGYIRLEGWLSGPLDEDSPVYLRLGDRLYEACPVGSWENGTPFTAYIEQSAFSKEAEVLYSSHGALYTSGPIIMKEG